MKKELLQKTKPELENALMEKRKSLEDLRFKSASGAVKNVKEIKETKRDIARILTILKNK